MIRCGYTIIKNLRKSSYLRYINFKAWNNSSSYDVTPKMSYTPLRISEGIFETCDLKNGMRLINEYKETQTTTIGCFLAAGSLFEKVEERGSALFTEHLMLRRTKFRNEKDLDNELGLIGGKLCTLATRDAFFFYGTAPSCKIDKLVELLADVMLNGVLCEEDLRKEKLIILQNLETMEKNHEQIVMDYLPTIAYQDSQLSNSIYPSTTEINFLNVNQMACFRERLFNPYFITMVSTGGTSMNEMQIAIEKHFSLIVRDNCPVEKTIKYFPKMPSFRFSGSELRVRNDDEKLGHVAIAIEGPGYENCEDHCALTVAKKIVGSWNLKSDGGYHSVSNLANYAFKYNLCYAFKSFNIGWRNTSLWGSYFSSDQLSLEDMQYALQKEWMRICLSVGEKEVRRAVNQCKTQELAKLNNSTDRFFDIAICLFQRGYYQTLEQRLENYENINAESIQEVMKKYVYDQCPVVIALGPIENLPDYSRIRSFMYSLVY